MNKLLYIFLCLSSFQASAQDAALASCGEIEAISFVPPEYPAYGSPRAIEGYAILEYQIDKNGNVSNVIIKETFATEKHPRFIKYFGENAVVAVEQWKYTKRQDNCVMTQKVNYEVSE